MVVSVLAVVFVAGVLRLVDETRSPVVDLTSCTAEALGLLVTDVG